MESGNLITTIELFYTELLEELISTNSEQIGQYYILFQTAILKTSRKIIMLAVIISSFSVLI